MDESVGNVSALGVFSSLFLFFVFFYFGFRLRIAFGIAGAKVIAVYFWHSFFILVYSYYVLTYGGDSVVYYMIGCCSPSVEFGVGTEGVNFLVYLISGVLSFDFFSTSIFFGFFGFVGLLALDGVLKYISSDSGGFSKKVAGLVVFLPSISFWSSGIGKDSLAFMSICLMLWSCIDIKRRLYLVAFSVALMFFVRPHIGGVMVVCIALNFVFSNKLSASRIFILVPTVFVVGLVAIPFALNYAGLGEARSMSDAVDYIETRQGYNQEGGGGVDISSMPIYLQVFTYLFRPLPFEAHSIAAFASSIDNVFLLLFFLTGFYRVFVKRWSIRVPSKTFLFSYSVTCLFLLSATTANLGISVRQKWMFVPVFIVLIFGAIRNNNFKNKIGN